MLLLLGIAGAGVEEGSDTVAAAARAVSLRGWVVIYLSPWCQLWSASGVELDD